MANMIEAATESQFKIAQLGFDRDKSELYDERSHSFFTVHSDGTAIIVDRKIGRGNRKSNDWLPMNDPKVDMAVQEWMAKQENRSVEIKLPWDGACMDSPVNRAYRVKSEDGLLMIRLSDQRTWSEILGASMLTLIGGPFKRYDGWEPVPADHFYATFDFNTQSPIRLGEQGRLNKRAYTEPNKTAMQLRPDGTPKRRNKKLPNPNAPVSLVDPVAITAAASIAQSLSTAILNTTGREKTELVLELKRLAGQVGWLLREDRKKYKSPVESTD